MISPPQPHNAASTSGMNSRRSRAASNTVAVVAASIVVTGFRSIFGLSRFSSKAAGFLLMSFQRSAWFNAEYSTRCIWCTVRGDSPPLPSRRPFSSALA